MEYMYLKYFAEDEDYPIFVQSGQHDGDMPIHYHNDFSELVMVTNGTATHVVDNEKYFIKKGDVFVINNHTSHGYEDPHDFKIYNIMYKTEYLYHSVNDIRKSAGFHALFVIEPYLAKEHNFNSRLTLELSDFEFGNQLISSMLMEYTQKNEGYQTFVQSYFMQLIVFLSRKYNFTEINKKDTIIHFATAISYMENHFKEPLSLQMLASKANISTRHFTRIFYETYETTPMNYVLQLRLQYACHLLKKSKLTIIEIAYESGFNDSNYFARQFKNIYGITPTKYRSDIKLL
ncbi:helix-turn-helix domain-containing protein [Anaeromicropila herbilytica]|uniref:AraC family transcriptional regulator n=1 Tax=Anaeromicropila herbilytica TaxID=2785025 RepID=A0A7R7EL84_9FIRM|nr:helix-turn-helix domain-containing protein [Anaeromicropila herbilytica]BCN31090.1 AraC family transcriptional regulator [Anaeromicropila herbilytica]